ncbi:nuclease-related domain-containing protein [Metabacillus fastidiosus]|uniref:nuclease-related domain-containing protein n=1 Tax=Metabacillus fastidiosus TaxID=1458 RepID=UPI002E1A1518|nr:nuclease-related domain-containing protein [Metabacillus fastidiosus]
MIIKKHEQPLYLQQLEALLRRLPCEHRKRVQIQEAYNKSIAGYKGEQSLQFPLSYLREDQYLIFYDLRLSNGAYFFQLDTLILSKKYFLIIEVKNITGNLYFDLELNQLIRSADNKEEAFPDPLAQVSYQRIQLGLWLEKLGFTGIPIETLIVIANTRSVIKVSNKTCDLSQKIIHSQIIPIRVNKLDKTYSIESLAMNNLHFLAKQMLSKHIPLRQNILKRFQVHASELLNGVQCDYCLKLPIERIHGSWLCKVCMKTSKNAHIKALKDYSLLIDTTINNKEGRHFLKVSSEDVVKRLFQTIPLEAEGMNKGRRYKLLFDILNNFRN